MIGILWGRRLVHHAKDKKAFSNNTWGGRKGRQPKDPVMLKKLSYTMAALTLTDLATFDNDTKACYDRIVRVLAMLRS